MLTLKLAVKRFDKQGKLVEKRRQQGRSFTLNFIGLLYLFHYFIITFTMKTVEGVDRDTGLQYSFRRSCGSLKVSSPAGLGGAQVGSEGNTTLWGEGQKVGIQIGTGVTAPIPLDYAMATRIAHGKAAGQMEYGGTDFSDLTISDPNGSFIISRYFTNKSGNTITVREVGIYAHGVQGVEAEVESFCIARDVLDTPVPVADNEILKISYQPQITV